MMLLSRVRQQRLWDTRIAIPFLVWLTISMTIVQSALGGRASPGSSIRVQTSQFIVNVTGNQNVPKYTFALVSDPDNIFKLQFQQMYEIYGNGKKVPTSTIALASLDWFFTDPVEQNGETTFNITSEGAPFVLTFVNHINTTSGNTYLKFDVILDRYSWISDDSTTSLVFRINFATNDDLLPMRDVYRLIRSSKQSLLHTQRSEQRRDNATTVTVSSGGNLAYYSIVPSASGGVKATLLPTDGGVLMMYSHFPNNYLLAHDPTFGILSLHTSTATSAPASTGEEDASTTSSNAAVSMRLMPTHTLWRLVLTTVCVMCLLLSGRGLL